MCRLERWSTRTLERKINSMLYERTALSRKSEELIQKELAALRDEDHLTPDLVFRDPYFLEFLGLKDRYLEKDLEDAILQEIESFLTRLPPPEDLLRKLHSATQRARARLEAREEQDAE